MGNGIRCGPCGQQQHEQCKIMAGCAKCDCWCRPDGSPKETWYPEGHKLDELS